MRKVIGIGETVYDIIFRNGQPVRSTPGGSTFNSIISIGRAGIPAEFISEVGDDRIGWKIREFLEANGVSAGGVCIHGGQQSALSLAFLDEHNDAQYQFYKDHAHDRLDFTFPDIRPDDVVIYGSFYAINAVVRDQVRPFLEYARERGAILYYDVNFRASHRADREKVMPFIRENMQLSDIVRGSHEDFNVLYGRTDVDEVFTSEVVEYAGRLIYTRGAAPAELRTAEGVRRQYPVSPVETVSTIGAGDSFNAGFIVGLIRHGITRQMLRDGLDDEQWDALFRCAQAFSANVCQSWFNYIDPGFAKALS